VAQVLSDVPDNQVWKILRRHGISLRRRRSWCVSTDPAFARKAADIVGLYLDPPEDAIVLAVDEKPAIQAMERAQGWLRRHPQVHFHFTPTYAPWLNQVKCWFSILSRHALRGASFTSPRQLREAIDRFIQAHNQRAAPFEWRKREVRPVGLKRTYAHLCN